MRTLVILCLLFSSFSFSQTKIYRGEYASFMELIYTISNKVIRRMASSNSGNDIMFLNGNKVYSDAFKSECLYTISGNKVYKGDSDSPFNLLYEMKDGQFFQASNSTLNRCIFTLYNNQVFVGDSRSTFECLYTVEFDENVNNKEILMFLCLAPY